ncbi:MAG: protein kinase [Solirubrobacterales bacterium]|jgi:CheY-like chemotaxis protein
MSGANRGHVLLVDDDLELLAVTAEALQAAGFKVDTARDGLEALACLETVEPEVVVADVEMPVMDGYELCRRVRASGRSEIPFLFCSGLGAPDARLEGLRVGADDYLQKPANADELVLKLTRQVERVRQFRAVSASAPALNAAALAGYEARLLRGGGSIDRLGRFELRAILGRGSMGTVFKAWDTTLERWVAVKTVRAGVGMAGFWDDDLVRRLVSEAAIVARFNHPHVVAVHDVRDAADAAYIVMELVDGLSLEALLRSSGRLGTDRTAPLVAALASALSAAHALNLMHRDVKPGNVLLGRDGTIKLTDFGIASFVSSHTRGRGFGTPGYVPPEAVRGDGIDASGDLFALGALAYRCLTGRPAVAGGTPSEILTNTMHGRVQSLRDAGTAAPMELVALVDGLLEPDREKRIGDAALLSSELARLSAAAGWRWAVPELAGAPAGGDAPLPEGSGGPHAQLFPTLDEGTGRKPETERH